MTESQFTQKLLKALRSHVALKDAVIFKHNDRTTRGVPDFSVSIGPRTIWCEVKRFPNQPTHIQWHFMNRLGIGCLLITDHRNGNVALYQLHRSVILLTFDALVQEVVWRCLNF